MRIQNPVLAGFHPDPSILRVGEDYYLATSTFEWCPGVVVHHSRDLVHWRRLGGVLDEPRLLDVTGVPDSGGVWAPDLTYANGRFHLVFSVLDNYAFGYKDLRNYLTTAPSVDGPWSDPVPLHGRGFDAALFHDDDGATWLLSMAFDSRVGKGFAGIEIQRLVDGALVGPPRKIFAGTGIGVTEGPHLYRVGDWYYLMVAEGGTGYEHGVTVARSRDLFGPYEPDPAGPMLTARHDPELALQKAGHGCLVATGSGEWYLSHLAARPYTTRGRCVLGRETALQRVEWVDGWPRVPGGVPALEVPAPIARKGPFLTHSDIRGPFLALGVEWSTLRRHAAADWLAVSGDSVRIQGGQSPYGLRSPSLVARPVTDRRCALDATVDFRPTNVHQAAGITAYYNTRTWYFLSVTTEGVVLVGSDRGARRELWRRDGVTGPVRLRVELDGPVLRFALAPGDTGGSGWEPVPVELDATTLSDEYADEIVDGQVRSFGFTGAFVGLWVQDLSNEGVVAAYSGVRYRAG
ncbi:glycoside hydrolase family 43 protein [Actinomycetes bacterium KLBMP 9797]